MTDKEKKSKIADILMDFQEEYSNEVINRPMLASLYAGNILSFIDSMQEEPVSEDLREASYRFACKCHPLKTEYSTTSPNPEIIKAFKAGAKWQKEQMIKNAIDGIARPDDNEVWCDLKSFNFKDGDKVKLIVIKEE